MGQRLLIADDDATFWIPSLLRLSSRGDRFEIDLALTPEQCWNAVAGGDFDVMLLDICFGDCEPAGLSLLPEIRRLRPSLKVVRFSSMDDRGRRRFCERHGAHAFVSKDNVTADDLWDTVEKVLAAPESPAPKE
jgi:DNA-binding NarL/FixJ family response regulator